MVCWIPFFKQLHQLIAIPHCRVLGKEKCPLYPISHILYSQSHILTQKPVSPWVVPDRPTVAQCDLSAVWAPKVVAHYMSLEGADGRWLHLYSGCVCVCGAEWAWAVHHPVEQFSGPCEMLEITASCIDSFFGPPQDLYAPPRERSWIASRAPVAVEKLN